MKISSRKSSIDHISSNYRQMLLIWAREQCQHYPGIYIEDFTNSWRNGRAFLAILHRHKFGFFDKIIQLFIKFLFQSTIHRYQTNLSIFQSRESHSSIRICAETLWNNSTNRSRRSIFQF